MREVYLDNSATTQTDPQVAQVALELMTGDYGNPSSLHKKGLEAQLRLDKARGQVAALLGCAPGEVVFTSGGTESNNLALFGAAQALARRGKTIVATAWEHASVLEPLARLEAQGFRVKRVSPTPEGQIDPLALADAVDSDTILVTCMLVNSEVGAVAPLAAAVRQIRRKNKLALIHSDGVQAFGKIPLSVKKMDVDLFTVSAHKLHAPKGCGALYVRRGARILPQLYGGSQENRLRAGTENTALACAFGLAAQLAGNSLEENYDKTARLRHMFLEQAKKIPGICINSPPDSTPYISNLSLPGYRSETLLHFLEGEGVYVSSGSACSKGAKSHVLAAMGLDQSRADSALRVSFSRYNTPADVGAFFSALQRAMASLVRAGGGRRGG